MLGDHLLTDLPDAERHLEQVGRRRQSGRIAPQAVENLLGRPEVPGGRQDEDPVGLGHEDVQLPHHADVVHPGVRPGVGEEEQSLVQLHRQAVRHAGAG